jgi:hypothetical protein
VGEGTRAEAEAKFRRGVGGAGKGGNEDGENPAEFWERRLLKPLPDFGGNAEMRELGAQIQVGEEGRCREEKVVAVGGGGGRM